jgi:two-component sensor histidine kinase
VGVLVDITAQKLAEQNAAMIAREMQHRVKNALTVVQTLAAHSFRGNTDVEEVRRSFMGRLGALAAATQSVTSDGWSDSDLHQLIEQIVKPYRGAERDPFLLQGPAVHLPRKGATAVALGLHELCTNAIKYGALSVPDGRVKIDWSMRDEMLLLTWTELDGPVVANPPAKGFGTTLLQRGLLEPGAVDLVFESTGVVCHFRVPTTP